jgi:TolB-like protein/Tfp pilus assembly protein PilF
VEKPFSAYRGDGPYVFVCYAHEDSEAVFREIAWLNDYGVNVWYDEGISPGNEWREELAAAIQGCSRILFFVSPRSVVSEHCRRELNFAQEEGREVVAIHLESTEVPAGLRLGLNNRQAILKHELSEDEFHKRLMRGVQGSVGFEIARSPEATVRLSRSRAALALIAAVMVLAAVCAWWIFTRDAAPVEADTSATASLLEAPAGDVLPNSIAVLPFENLSPDPNNAYFAAGIHEELLNQLVRINDLSVIARTSVLQYANTQAPVSRIADELKVSKIMQGSVRYAGDRVRIVAQLVDPISGVQLWSEIYERKLEDVFGIQQDIAISITTALQAEFSHAEEQAISALPTTNPDAYRHYIRALARFGSLESIEPMIEDLRTAIALDTKFAEALALLAYLYAHRMVLDDIEGGLLTPESQQRDADLAADVARRALAINPNLGRAYQALAYVDFYEGRTSQGEFNLRRSVEVAPNDRLMAHEYGYQLVRQGKVTEGIAYVDHAIALDPKNWVIPYYAARIFTEAYLLEESMRMARRVIEIEPDLPMGYLSLARTAVRQQDRSLAREMVALAEQLGVVQARSPLWLTWLLEIYSRLEHQSDVDRILELIAQFEPASAINARHWFSIHMTDEDYESALEDLHRVLDERFPEGLGGLRDDLLYLSDTPYFDPIREHPRFQEALIKVYATSNARPSAW